MSKVGNVAASSFSLAAAGDLAGLKEVLFTGGILPDLNGSTLLHHASKNGHVSVICYLLTDCGLDIDAQDTEGNSALHLAIMSREVKAMELLLNHGSNCALTNYSKATPLEMAVRSGSLQLLEVLLSHSSVGILDTRGDKQKTILHVVAENGLVEQARVIMSSKQFDRHTKSDNILTWKDESGLTFLHSGAKAGSHEVISLMLNLCKKYGCEVVDCVNNDGFSPLQTAVNYGKIEVVRVLLEYGASPLATTENQPPPLHLACTQGRLDVVSVMVELCGDEILNRKDPSGKAPLHYTISSAQCSVVLAYITGKHCVDVNIRDDLGRTPLHLAALLGKIDRVKQLVDSKADLLVKDDRQKNLLHFSVLSGQLNVLNYVLCLPNVLELAMERNMEGDTPFQLAIKRNAAALCCVMLKSTTLCDIQDSEGNSYIHLAAITGNASLLQEILTFPAYQNSLNSINTNGETPIHLAAEGGNEECVEMLISFGALTHKCCSGKTALLHASCGGHMNCVKVLVNHFPFQKDWTDGRGNSALHCAVQSANPLMVTYLLDQGSKLCLNHDSQSFLEVAINKDATDLVMAVLSHSRWEECLNCFSPTGSHPMLLLIRSMPTAAKLVLDRCHEKAALEKSHPKYWEQFNFKYLELKSGGDDDDLASRRSDLEAAATAQEHLKAKKHHTTVNALSEMLEVNQVELLNHPVVSMYIRLKWNTYGIWFYSLFFALRFMVAVLISLYTALVLSADRASHASGSGSSNDSVMSFEGANSTVGTGPQIIRVLALVINLLLFLHILLPIISVGLLIFNFVENFVLWIYGIAIVSTFVYLLIPDPIAAIPAGAIACFSCWLAVLSAMAFFDIFGIYVRMFFRVTRTVFQVLLLSLSLLFAFSFAFYALAGSMPGFSTVSYALVSVFHYMLGDFQQEAFIVEEIEGRLENGGWIFVFLFLMTIFLSIVMANLLIGLAVGDIDKFKRNASIEKKVVLIAYFKHIDKFPLFKHFQRTSYVKYPNAKVSKIRSVWRTLWRAAKEDAIAKEDEGDDKKMSTDEKLDLIINHLDQLTSIYKTSYSVIIH